MRDLEVLLERAQVEVHAVAHLTAELAIISLHYHEVRSDYLVDVNLDMLEEVGCR